MLKSLFKLTSILAISLSALSFASDRIYIDDESLDHKQDAFHIHIGGNVWLETSTVHRDKSGLYTLDSYLLRSKTAKGEYQRTWKCPYCYRYWPIGTACQNADCPSKYK